MTTKLVLAHHTPEEWGEALAKRLKALGCSPEYCAAAAEQILARAEVQL